MEDLAAVLVVGVLVGLVLPIGMLLGALVFDLFLVLWVAFQIWRDEMRPKIRRIVTGTMGHLHLPARHLHAH